MKLQPDKFDAPAISSYGPGWLDINGEKLTLSVVIGSRGQRLEWGCRQYDDLNAGHFDLLAQQEPELVIFGSGTRIRFPKPQWLQTLMAQRIGIETMDTQAACRTYNILAGEGRNVIAALLLEDAG
jgi:uncharacterized protein